MIVRRITVIEMDSVNKRQKQWIYSILIGVISVVIGALLVIYKRDSLNIILIISGVLLIIDGAIAIIGGLMDKVLIPVVVGGSFVALGVAIILFTNLFTDIFMILLGVLLILMGVLGAMSAFDKSENGFIGMIISFVFAAALILAGIITLFNLDEVADWVMIAIGVITIISGALNIIGGIVTYNALRNAQ